MSAIEISGDSGMQWLVVDKNVGPISEPLATREAAELWRKELIEEIRLDMFLPRAQKVLRLATAESEERLEEKARDDAAGFVFESLDVVQAV